MAEEPHTVLLASFFTSELSSPLSLNGKTIPAGSTIVMIPGTKSQAVQHGDDSLDEYLAGRENFIASTYYTKADIARKFQDITTVIKNRGVVYGCGISKSASVTRALNCEAGRVFMNGRAYSLARQNGVAALPANSGGAAGTAIIYAILENGAMAVKTTTLNGAMPDAGIELARASIPAGNNASNDAHLAKATITFTARVEAKWPAAQSAPPTVNVSLPTALANANYVAHVDINSCTGVNTCTVDVSSKLNNGFKLVYHGTADNIRVRALVEHPGA